MKPTTSKDLAVTKAPKIEIGSLYFHEENPNKVLMCTKVTTHFVHGIIIHSPFHQDLGVTAEYSNARLKLFNGRLTLEQYMLDILRTTVY